MLKRVENFTESLSNNVSEHINQTIDLIEWTLSEETPIFKSISGISKNVSKFVENALK